MQKALILICLSLLLSITARSQSTITAQAFAEVIAALTATETAQLNFGRFSPEVQGGQVIVTPSGVRSTTGSVVLGGGASSSGKFYITGAPDATFSIQLPTEPSYLLHQNSNKTMVVSNWSSVPAAGEGTGILVNGEQYVNIGATLMVGSLIDNPVGMYAGTYELTFAYN